MTDLGTILAYAIGGVIIAIMTAAGFGFKRIFKSMDNALQELLKEWRYISNFLTRQDEKNKNNEKEHADILGQIEHHGEILENHEHKITILETEHKKNHGD